MDNQLDAHVYLDSWLNIVLLVSLLVALLVALVKLMAFWWHVLDGLMDNPLDEYLDS